MRFCTEHWNTLKKAIVDRGLESFIAIGGESVVKRVVAGGYEPLMGAHNEIVSHALSVDMAIMSPNVDGSDRCPLCFLLAGCACPHKGTPQCAFAAWIEAAADGQFAEAKRLGLLGEA